MATELEQAKTAVQQKTAPPSIAETIENIRRARLESDVAGLESQRTQARSSLQAEESVVRPEFARQRADVQTRARQSEQSLAQRLASLGLARGGETTRRFSGIESARQGALSGLGRQETGILTDLERRRGLVEGQFATGVAGATAGALGQAQQEQLGELRDTRSFDRSENARLENLGFQREQFGFQKSQADIENTFRQTQANISNALQNRQIGNQEAAALSAQADRARAFELSEQQFGLQQEQFNQQTQFGTEDRETNAAQQEIQNAFDQKVFDANEAFRLGQVTKQVAQQIIDNANSERQIAIQEANLVLNQNATGAPPDPLNDIENFSRQIEKQFIIPGGFDPDSLTQVAAKVDKEAVLQYLSSLQSAGVDGDTIFALGVRYGLVDAAGNFVTDTTGGGNVGGTGGGGNNSVPAPNPIRLDEFGRPIQEGIGIPGGTTILEGGTFV